MNKKIGEQWKISTGSYESQLSSKSSGSIWMQREKSWKLSNLFTERVIVKKKNIPTVHKKTIHVGVTIAMSNIRTYHWIPSLRKITKSIIKKCHHCAWYRAIPFAISKPGLLSKRRNQECHPFQVIGVDYTGPIYYRSRNKAISKSYILLFWCSVSRAIYLELVPDLTNQEFIKSMKRLSSRRWSSNIILTILFWRHSRLELSGLTELIKTKSLTIFWVLRV